MLETCSGSGVGIQCSWPRWVGCSVDLFLDHLLMVVSMPQYICIYGRSGISNFKGESLVECDNNHLPLHH